MAKPRNWELLKEKLEALAEQLDAFNFVCRKHPLLTDLKKAAQASELSYQCQRLANRTLTWPGLSETGQKGEWAVALEQFHRIQREAKELMGSWRPPDSERGSV